ncbi:MAG: 2TM domain-containing protein [Polyangiales bacterium]
MPDTYSRDEVKEILGRALEKQHAQGDAITHDELAAVARDMGVAPEALAQAAAAVREERELQSAVSAAIARRRRGFSAHLMAFVMVNALLTVGNLMTGGPLWFVLVALAWGIGLAFHARAAFAPTASAAARARRRIRARPRTRRAPAPQARGGGERAAHRQGRRSRRGRGAQDGGRRHRPGAPGRGRAQGTGVRVGHHRAPRRAAGAARDEGAAGRHVLFTWAAPPSPPRAPGLAR